MSIVKLNPFYKFISHSVRSALFLIVAAVAGLVCLLVFVQPTPVLADTDTDTGENQTQTDPEGAILDSDNSVVVGGVCDGVNLSPLDQEECDTREATETLNKTVRRFIDLFSIVVGITALIMLIYGAFRYVISRGSEDGVKTARNTILYSIIGIAVATLAQVIPNAIIEQLLR